MTGLWSRAIPGLIGALLLLPGLVQAQDWNRVDAAVEQGITQRIYPGAVLVVGRGDTILYSKGYGHYTWAARSEVPDPQKSLWDLASLTKVVATTPAVAVLVEKKKLDLDAPVSRYLPEFTGGKKAQVTVRMLLNHSSGLPAGYPIYKEAKNPAEARALVFRVPLARTPGSGVIYSDLNAILAGMIVERVSGVTLDRYAQDHVFTPIGLGSGVLWKPTAAEQTRTVPTGKFRDTPVGGVVYDQNAAALGGVSGHAGLFATGSGLARYFQSWLRATGKRQQAGWAHPGTLNDFIRLTPGTDSRVLGWDTPSIIAGSEYSLYGKCATRTTVGHTGWTGTMGWFDRSNDLFLVLLTNRSFDPANPDASFKQLKEVRVAVSDAARRASGEKGC